MVDNTEIIDKDAWLVQAVGGTKNYGNGQDRYIVIGPAPSADGTVQYKGRGVFQVQLRNGSTKPLDGITGFDSAEIEVTVAGTSCIGSRGSTIRILLEEITADFTEFNAGGDCNFGSTGPATGEWGADSGVITTNRAFHSSGSHSAGDKLTWDVTDLITAKLEDPSATVLRFRLIAANTGGTGYDETTTARRIQIYSSEDATSDNRPLLRVVNVVSGTTNKNSDDSGVGSETWEVLSTGTDPESSEAGVGTDAVAYVGPVPTWAISGSTAKVTLPIATTASGVNVTTGQTMALLSSVNAQDILISSDFIIKKLPLPSYLGIMKWRWVGRYISSDTFYRMELTITGAQKINMNIHKVVGGTLTSLGYIFNVHTAIVEQIYRIRFLITGTNPTSLAAKIWRAELTEPASYQLTAQDAEASLQAAGAVGLAGVVVAGTNLPITAVFDNYEVIEA